jgi:predicted HTH transcriptional regulator
MWSLKKTGSSGIRESEYYYPEIVIRELLANALVHQDFSRTGTRTMIEIYSNRIEFTNPGLPQIDTLRFIDIPPFARNPLLALEMSKLGICEQRGSGWDKIAEALVAESYPAPIIEKKELFTQVTLYQKQNLNELNKREKVLTVYMHAQWLWVNSGEFLTNSVIRKAFQIEQSKQATMLINDTIAAGFIKRLDKDSTTQKTSKYVPYWVDVTDGRK